MGNTCYINSALQVLIHLPLFWNMFSDPNFLKEINNNYQFSIKGFIAMELFHLYKVLNHIY